MFAMRSAGEPSGYSFAAANLAKLLDLPRYAWGALRSLAVRRDRQLWVIGSNFGLADGAWAFHQAAARLPRPPRLVWQVIDDRQREQAVAAGVEWVDRDSAEGFELALHAGVIAVTHGLGDVNRYAQRGAVIVQLWHGSPLKKLNLDSPSVLNLGRLGRVPLAATAIRAMYRAGTSGISVFPVACEEFATSIRSAFGLGTDQVPAIGEPRADALFAGTPAQRRQASRELWEAGLGPLGDSRLILHAPTWRDGDEDPTIPTAAQWQAIDAYCRSRDAVLVVRPHPKCIGDYTFASQRVRVIGSDAQPDIMPLLWGVDVLVTDYSSVLFDFSVTGNPILYLAPDLEHYRATRGLYLDYADLCGGRPLDDWDQVIGRLESWQDPAALAADQALTRAVFERFIAHRDGRNAERTVARVLDLLDRKVS